LVSEQATYISQGGGEWKYSIIFRFLPLLIIISYLVFSVLLFFFGPWPYPVEDNNKLIIFLTFAHLALFTGYSSAAFNRPADYFGRWKVQHLVIFSIVVNLLIIMPTFMFRTGSITPDILGAIRDPGQTYAIYGFHNREGVPIIEYIRILLALPLSLYLPLSFFYWGRIKRRVLLLSSLIIIGTISMYLAMGTNKGIFDIVLLAISLIIAGDLSGISSLKKFWKIIISLMGLVAVILFLMFFTSTQSSREGSGAKAGYFYKINRYAELDTVVTRNFSENAKIGWLGLNSYLTQGYYGLYLSLKEPFVPMYGVGNSMFLYRQAARITQNDKILDMPYPMRIDKYGWDGYGNWSSIYPWIASDVSFPGTILVVFFIGRLFALSWLDTLRGKNPFAVVLFGQLLIMLVYFPGNNQVLQGGEGLIAFYGTLLLWLGTRKRFHLKSV